MACTLGAGLAPAAAQTGTPQPAPGPGIGIQLLQAPASTISDPRTHAYIVDQLAPGTTIARQLAVTNGQTQTAHVALYPDAAVIQAGTFQALDGRARNELTGWMTMSPTQAVIAPGQTLAVTVTIAVPADAAPGERYATALAESPVSPAIPQGGGSVHLVSRVGIRVYLSVGGGQAPAPSFAIDALTAGRDAGGQPWVTAQVHNTGGRAVDLGGQLTLAKGPAGLSAGPFPVDQGVTLGVGDHGTVTVRLPRELPAGPWDAGITLVSGLLREQASAQVTFPAPGTAVPPSAATQPHARGLLPVVVGAGILVALLVALGRLLLGRRRRGQA